MGFLYSQLFITPALPTQSFAGQTVLVTGANVGLGKEAARHFARLGATKIIIAVRNLESGEAARKDIIATTRCPEAAVEVWKLDLGDYDSVKAFADKAKSLPRIDVLLENAGIATGIYNQVAGHEATITVNVISTFLLALLVLPTMQESAKQHNTKPRLVIVSSEVHAWSKFEERHSENIFKTLDAQDTANMPERYPTSKLLEVLVVRHIAPKLRSTNVVINYLNPGLCHSSLSRTMSGFQSLFFTVMKAALARTTEVGGRTLVAAAAADESSHGKYMSDGVVDEASLSPFARSEEGEKVGQKVWLELKDILEEIQSDVTNGL